jgi:ArsR family metal-binding transcriptional regulator
MHDDFYKLFVVEYSAMQNAFHVQTVSEMLLSNIRRFTMQDGNDYVPMAFTETKEEADKIVASLRERVNQFIDSERERRREKIREEFGIDLSLSDLR